MKFLLCLALLSASVAFPFYKIGGKAAKAISVQTNALSYIDREVVYTYKDIYNKQVKIEHKTYTIPPVCDNKEVLICYRANDVYSLEAALLASNLWKTTCYLLEISDQGMTTHTDHWGTATYDYYDVWDDGFRGEYQVNNVAASNNWIAPVERMLTQHPNIMFIANSYRVPYKTWKPAGYMYSPSIVQLFYAARIYNGITDHTYPTIENNEPFIFWFGCRTFNDTTNLLIKTANFDAFNTNGYFVQDDCSSYWYAKAGHYAGMFPIGDQIPESVNKIYDLTDNKILSVPGKIYFLQHNGFWAGYNDNYLRVETSFIPYPNSVISTVESYNLLSYRKGIYARMHQGRLFDAFDANCNQGTGYSRTFGCAVGHLDEPYGQLVKTPIFLFYVLRGFTFVEAFWYSVHDQIRLAAHIVCGNPFLRLKPNLEE